MNQQPASFNPYATPAAVSQGLEALPEAPASPRDALKWIYLGLSLVSAALSVTGLVGVALGLQPLVAVVAFTNLLPLVGGFCLALAWIVSAWHAVPVPCREGMTTARAVGRMFIPFYGLYWIIQMPRLLCDAIDRALLHAGRAGRTPRDLAIWAGAGTIMLSLTRSTVPKELEWVATLTSHALWFAFMLRADRSIRAMFAALVAGGAERGATAPSSSAP